MTVVVRVATPLPPCCDSVELKISDKPEILEVPELLEVVTVLWAEDVDIAPEAEGAVESKLMMADDGVTLPNPMKDPVDEVDVKLFSLLLLAVLATFWPITAVIKRMLKMSFFIFVC